MQSALARLISSCATVLTNDPRESLRRIVGDLLPVDRRIDLC